MSGALMITHDLGVVAESAHDRVAVMYAGKIVEYANTDEDLFAKPACIPIHHRLDAILASIPTLGEEIERLYRSFPATVPNGGRVPRAGVKLSHPRCPLADRIKLQAVGRARARTRYEDRRSEHTVACHHLEESGAGLRSPSERQGASINPSASRAARQNGTEPLHRGPRPEASTFRSRSGVLSSATSVGHVKAVDGRLRLDLRAG